MTYEDFIQHLTKNVMHEARYQDSEGRSILVICVADAYDMVKNAIKEEREACARVCEAQRDARIETRPAVLEQFYKEAYEAGFTAGVANAADLCDRFHERQMNPAECAAAIRARGEGK